MRNDKLIIWFTSIIILVLGLIKLSIFCGLVYLAGWILGII